MIAPIDFPQSNLTMNAPAGMEDSVLPLPVYRDDYQLISCWKLSDQAISELTQARRLWLFILGAGMPPVGFSSSDPFVEHTENTSVSVKSLTELEAERLAWSLSTFTEASPISSLRKLESEIQEIEKDILNGDNPIVEYTDALMCLFDSAGRMGITVEQITQAFATKLEKNKARQWVKNPDNSYSHVKDESHSL